MTTHRVFARMRIRDWLGVVALAVPSLPIVLLVATAVLADGTSLWSAIGWYVWVLPGTVSLGVLLLGLVYLLGWVWDLRAHNEVSQ